VIKKTTLSYAAKARERKNLKLEQVAHDYSQNIPNMFNVITKKTSKLEPQVILVNYNRTIGHSRYHITIIIYHKIMHL